MVKPSRENKSLVLKAHGLDTHCLPTSCKEIKSLSWLFCSVKEAFTINISLFRSSKYNGISTPDEYLEYCVREQSSGSCIPRICAFSKPIRTCKPFPHIFDPRVSVDGNILGKQR